MSVTTIDGSYGEGGGQILRTALSLSAILARPVRIVNIRAGRKKPGLRPQHVQSAQAAAAICGANVDGLHEHSTQLLFEPQTHPQAGKYQLDIGTAGACTLLLQTVLTALALADGPSLVTVQGGTHVAWSPPYHYLEEVYLPALEPLGYRFTPRLASWGFYPKGGGRLETRIQPRGDPSPDPPSWSRPRTNLQRLHVLSAASNVGNQVTARQARQAYNRLAGEGFRAETTLLNPPSRGPGTCVFLLAEYDGGVRAGFTGYGRLGYPAERVADDAVDGFLRFHRSAGTVDPHLADQLVLPLVLAGKNVSYTTCQVTQHLLTNVWAVSQFMPGRLEVHGTEGQPGQVRCLN